MSARGGGLAEDARGAVYVEFLIAFLPLFTLFMSLVQLAYVEAANVVTKHAAVMAARAAIVVLPDDPAHYDGAETNAATGRRLADVTAAAAAPLHAVANAPEVRVTFLASAGSDDERQRFAHDSLVRVKVDFDYPCQVPIGMRFVCGLDGNKTLSGYAAMPMQGATYAYESE